jgi:hypothetical protein
MPEPKSIDPRERPSLTPERNVEAAVEDSFPASDPSSATASQGARAAPVEAMMDPTTPSPPTADQVTLTRRFHDAETAKLALESLVREGPLDRRCARIAPDGAGATLALQASRGDAARIGALLQGAPDGP